MLHPMAQAGRATSGIFVRVRACMGGCRIRIARYDHHDHPRILGREARSRNIAKTVPNLAKTARLDRIAYRAGAAAAGVGGIGGLNLWGLSDRDRCASRTRPPAKLKNFFLRQDRTKTKPGRWGARSSTAAPLPKVPVFVSVISDNACQPHPRNYPRGGRANGGVK
jgi:hypothetical protein